MMTDSMAYSPLVSVVITCYNQGRYLAEAIESVQKQTYDQVEVIIVDDGSADDTAAVASQFGEAQLIRQANAGLPSARNAGLYQARGKYIMFLDADDLLLPKALELGVACHRASPGCAFVYGGHRRISAEGRVLSQRASPLLRDAYQSFLQGNLIAMHGTVLYDREMLRSAGGFDTSLDACEDYDVYLRLSRAHCVAFHNQVVAAYRQHDSNMSRDAQRMLRAATAVLQAQVKHTKLDPARKSAYRYGLRFWRSLYGLPLIVQAVRDLRIAGRRAQAVRRLLWAMRHSPSIFLTLGAPLLSWRLLWPLRQLLNLRSRGSPCRSPRQ